MDAENRNSKSLKIISVILAVVVVACAVALGMMWNKLNEVQAKVPVDSEVEMKALVSEIGRFLTLPNDETPTLVTLKDEELLSVKSEPFFANALPGDKLLIYQNNNKAVIWRPASKKVIEASIINLAAPAAGL
jgi:hypothetical protein